MQLEATDWSIRPTLVVHPQGFTPTFVTFSTGVDTIAVGSRNRSHIRRMGVFALTQPSPISCGHSRAAARLRGGVDRVAFDESFADDPTCLRYLEDLRWREGLVCPSCGGSGTPWRSSRGMLICPHCRKHASVWRGPSSTAPALRFASGFSRHELAFRQVDIAAVPPDRCFEVGPPASFLYVGGGDEIVVVDRASLEIMGSIQLPGMIGGGPQIAADSRRNLACEEEAHARHPLPSKRN